jgi:FkbM family methyltransferase
VALPTNDRKSGRHASYEHLRKAMKLMKLLRRRRWRNALRHGVGAAVEHEAVAFQHEFASVIDVGAHHGQFALFAAERFRQASLYCFEPLPEAGERLATVLADRQGVRIFQVAAASDSAVHELHVSRLDDSSSLLPITDRYTTAWPGTEEAGRIEVQTVRLEDVIETGSIVNPCLLKIDVQGGELDVLRGAEALLASIDEVFLEGSFMEFYDGQPLAAEVISHLHHRGFQLVGVFGLKRDRAGRCLQADFLFERARSR